MKPKEWQRTDQADQADFALGCLRLLSEIELGTEFSRSRELLAQEKELRESAFGCLEEYFAETFNPALQQNGTRSKRLRKKPRARTKRKA